MGHKLIHRNHRQIIGASPLTGFRLCNCISDLIVDEYCIGYFCTSGLKGGQHSLNIY